LESGVIAASSGRESRAEVAAVGAGYFPILVAAPGAGLGHLVRACAVSVELAQLGLRARIITHSIYAEGLRRLTGCSIDFIPASHWRTAVPRYVDHWVPKLVVLDTFPWGIRGEWADTTPRRFRFVLLARRLNVPAYLQASGLGWNPESPTLRHVIVCEPLSRAYRALLEDAGSELHVLPGRIRFPWIESSIRVPTRLMETLGERPTWLVVHSGPLDEVERLVELAGTDMAMRGVGQIVAILPQGTPHAAFRSFEFFPASLLYPYAHRVVTGAGYNCIAEAVPWRAKHLCHPFARRYDEQQDRLGELSADPVPASINGAGFAAQCIASFL
jgi:hypothetical protein